MPPRSLPASLLLVLATVALGLAIRFASIGLPAGVVKYGGSILWAAMIYWIVSSLLGSSRLLYLAFLAGILATAVEFFKLFHSPGLDAFRLTLPGILLFGRYFSLWDILAYWTGIALAAVLDSRIRRI
jgi:hypothetical protein